MNMSHKQVVNNEILPKRPRIDSEEDCEIINFLSDLNIFLFHTGIGCSRLKCFRNLIEKYGGTIATCISNSTTHVIVDDSLTLDRICKVLKWTEVPFPLKIVKTAWLSNCIKANTCLETEDYELRSSVEEETCSCICMDEEINISKSLQVSEEKNISNDKYVPDSPENKGMLCAIPANSCAVNHNEHVTEKLQILAKTYRDTGDHWRAVGYEKAIIVLKNYPKRITSWEEARSVKGIGEKLADNVWEIIHSGSLRKIQEVCHTKQAEAMSLFTKVWGVGPTTARAFAQQGFCSLEDLKTKAKLTKVQQIGLKYFDDLLCRIPRTEVFEIFSIVERHVKLINADILCELCGSYRRNQETCGDIDILLTLPEDQVLKGLLAKLVSSLHKIDLLTDDLVNSEDKDDQRKYLGICKLPSKNAKYRRIDIFVALHNEYACALMHYTGSAFFNMSIRQFAAKKNMCLSDHSLKADVTRHSQSAVEGGIILPTPTEESIFKHLGLEYRSPTERDHFAVD